MVDDLDAAGRDRALSDADRAGRIPAAAARRQCRSAADARRRSPPAASRRTRRAHFAAQAERRASWRRCSPRRALPPSWRPPESRPRRRRARRSREWLRFPKSMRQRCSRSSPGSPPMPARCSTRRSRIIATRPMSRGSRPRSRGCARTRRCRSRPISIMRRIPGPFERDGRAARARPGPRRWARRRGCAGVTPAALAAILVHARRKAA